MITLKKDGSIEFEEQAVVLKAEELSKFLLANISQKISLEEGVDLAAVIHFFYPIKEFVTDYMCEDYFTVSSVLSSFNAEGIFKLSSIIGRKEIVISDENEIIRPIIVDFQSTANDVKMIREAKLVLSKEVLVKNQQGEEVFKKLKEDFLMLELIELVFETLYYKVVEGFPQS